jgi:hypothetical protein
LFEIVPLVALRPTRRRADHRLNRAVAIAEAGALERGVTELDRLGEALATYQP